MSYIHFECPAVPYFITAGTAHYRQGDRHKRRTNIGVFDLLFVVSGELFIAEENNFYSLKENSLLILSPNKTHYGYKYCTSETTFYWVHIGHSGDFYESDQLKLPHKHSSSLYRESPFYISLPKYAELTGEESALLSSYIKPLLAFAVNKFDNKTKKVKLSSTLLQRQRDFIDILNLLDMSAKTSSGQNSIAFEVMQFLQNNYDKSFTLEDLSKRYNFHPVHIIRCMKKSYNMTPIQALTQIRLEKAKELLVTTSCTINTISEQVGFSSSSYFIKQFKSTYHTTPTQYRFNSRNPFVESK